MERKNIINYLMIALAAVIVINFFNSDSDSIQEVDSSNNEYNSPLDELSGPIEIIEIPKYNAEIVEEFKNNSLKTGSTPYRDCYGRNQGCRGDECHSLTVNASSDQDVIVRIKEDGKTISHAYIQRGDSYSFDLKDGVYQTFFQSGNGWYPDAKKVSNSCDTLYGEFLDEVFSMDEETIVFETIETATNITTQTLEYTLESVISGNFQVTVVPEDAVL